MVERILADLHTHLNEKKLDPKEWWASAIEKKLSVIAITEHAEYEPKSAYLKLLKIKPKHILLIPGFEANTSAGHLLIFGTDEKIFDYKELLKIKVPIETALEIIRKNNLTASFSHPFGYKSDSTCEIIGEKKSAELVKKYSIGSEYYNGMLGSANNFIFATQWVKKLYNFFDFASKNKIFKLLKISKKSKKIKDKLDKISLETFERVRKGIEFSKNAAYITVGSDAHYPRVIGTAILELKKKPKNNADCLEMIKKKQINWAGPNIYSDQPVDKLKKKELLEGLKYVTKAKFKKKIRRNKK
jgi:hypothetical protein